MESKRRLEENENLKSELNSMKSLITDILNINTAELKTVISDLQVNTQNRFKQLEQRLSNIDESNAQSLHTVAKEVAGLKGSVQSANDKTTNELQNLVKMSKAHEVKLTEISNRGIYHTHKQSTLGRVHLFLAKFKFQKILFFSKIMTFAYIS
jgi:hypothetical protein